MNKLTLKTTRDVVNEPVLVHIMKYDKNLERLVNICGYEFTKVNSVDKIIELDLGSDEKAKTGDDNVAKIPYGAIIRVECPKGSDPVFIEDMLSLDPSKNAAIFAREFPDEISNIESVIKNNDGFKVTLKEAAAGNLELYEISDKTNPTNVIQRLVLPTSIGSTIYTFTPVDPVNIASNIVCVRWTIANYSKPAGVNVTAIDLASAPRIEITGISLNNGILNIAINNMDSNKPFTATEADVYFTGSDGKVTVLRGTIENDTVSGKGKIVFTQTTSTKLNSITDTGTVNAVLIGELSNKVDYNYNISGFKSDPTGITVNTNDITFNDAGNKMTFLVKDEKNITGATVAVSSIQNEYVAGKLLYDNPVITRKTVGTDNYWEIVVNNIRTIPIDRLYKTHVEITYTEPNKLPNIIADKVIKKPKPGGSSEDTEGVKPMKDAVALFNDTTGYLEFSMTGPYNIQSDQSYKIRDINLSADDQLIYSHAKTETITGSNNIRIITKYNSDNGPIDTISFRYSYANKLWSPIQDIECPNIYKEHITRLIPKIKASKYKIVQDNLILEDNPFIPMPTSIIAHKTVKGNTTNIESSNIVVKNRTVMFKLGTFTGGSEDEEVSGFTINFTYVYDEINVDITKEYKLVAENLDVDKVKSVKWNIMSPESVWGDYLEPFNNPGNTDNEAIKQYGNIIKGLYNKNINIESYWSNSEIRFLRKKGKNYKELYPIMTMEDSLPLTDKNTYICWCSKFKISKSDNGYMFKQDLKDLKLKCEFKVGTENKIAYVKFKNVKKLIDSVECIDAYLVDSTDNEITMSNFNIFADSIVNGMPFISDNKSNLFQILKRFSIRYALYFDKSRPHPEYYDFKYSRWGDHKQLFPFNLVMSDTSGINCYMNGYDIPDDGTNSSDLALLKSSKYTNTYENVGITVTPELTFKNGQKIELSKRIYKTKAEPKYAKLNTVLNEVGITAMNTVNPMYNDYINEPKDVVNYTTQTYVNHIYNLLPIFSNMTFKFSSDFKKLHFSQPIEINYMVPMILPWSNIADKYKPLQSKVNITHMRINYIGKAVTSSGNGRVIDMSNEDVSLLNAFTQVSLNQNKYINNATNDKNLSSDNTIVSGARTRDIPLYYFNNIDMYKANYINKTTNNTHIPTLSYMSYDGSTWNEDRTETYQNGKVNYNIYKYPNIMRDYKKMKYNIDNGRDVFTNISIDRDASTSTHYTKRDLLIYNDYNVVKYFTKQDYNSSNLLAKPIILKASIGKDENMLSDYQKVFFNQVDHIIFTTSGNINDTSNKEIFNYREMKNDNYDYVIKYQLKFEGEDDFSDELIYYMNSFSIENALLDIPENVLTWDTIKNFVITNNLITNRYDLCKIMEGSDVLRLDDNTHSIWNGKEINALPINKYKFNYPNDAVHNRLGTILPYCWFRAFIAYNDEFEAVYTDKTKNVFDVAREYLNTHSDHNISPIDYKLESQDIKPYTPDPTLFKLPELFKLLPFTCKNYEIKDIDSLIRYNIFNYSTFTWGDKRYGEYRVNPIVPFDDITQYNPFTINLDENKKIKIYLEIVVPPSRMYPSIVSNKTLFDHNIIKLESKVIDLYELKNYGNNINSASLIDFNINKDNHTINVTAGKITGLDSIKDYLYNKLVPNESDRFYNKYNKDKIFTDLNSCKIKIKEIPGLERSSVNVKMNGDLNEVMCTYSPGSFVSTTRPDFMHDLANYNKNCTVVIEGDNTYREFKFNNLNNDTTLLTANDKEFVRLCALTGITGFNESQIDIDLTKSWYIAESIAKPDWIKMNIWIGDTSLPIMFSKLISPEENKRYTYLNLYNYKMQLDPEWYNRLKSEADNDKINDLYTALDNIISKEDENPITKDTIHKIDFTFSYNGINVFNVYSNNIYNSAICKADAIEKNIIPLFKNIANVLKSKGHKKKMK